MLICREISASLPLGQEGNPGFRAREKAFADRIEKARSKAGFPKTLRMSSGGGFRQQGPGLVNEL